MRFGLAGSPFDFRKTLLAGTALASFLLSYPAHATSSTSTALPQGGTVVSGSAKIIVKSNEIIVKQTSEKAVIDWQSFNIGAGDKVLIIEPNQLAQILNQVVGASASQILGQLKANGTVILTNPNGILFGPNANVSVKAIIATTTGITPQNFMAGNLVFNIASNSSTASVVNLGTITAKDAGLVGLVAPGVENSGIIEARLGSVQLVSGNVFTIDLYGDKLIKLAVNDTVLNRVTSPDGTPLTSNVANHGLIEADGGTVIMSAAEARNVVSSVVNMDGIVRARTVGTKNGEILLNGGTGSVDVTGTLDVSSPGKGNAGSISVKGGTTKVTGTLLANSQGGNGGQVETSGEELDIDGIAVNVSAPNGTAGNLLLDPVDLTIDAGAAASIDAALATGSVTLQTTASSATTTYGGMTNSSGVGDINIDAPITWNANTILTLDAYHGVNVNANITANGATSGVAIVTNDGGTGGNFLTGADASVTLNGANAALSINGSPYTLIRTASQLKNLPTSGNFALANDVDLSSIANFTPAAATFLGTFNGLGHTVSNLTIDNPSGNFLGLFSTMGGAVSNLIVDGNVTGGSGFDFGLLAGQNFGTILNVSSAGSVTGGSGSFDIGGLVGASNGGSISDSYATGTVTAGPSSGDIGGLVGANNGSIAASFATGTVNGNTSAAAVGGLAGSNTGTITASYNTATINADGASAAGGLVGENNGSIISSYSTGAVNGNNDVGGLVGWSPSGSITGSYATAPVTGVGSSGNVGGLVGSNGGSITNSYATGTVSTGASSSNTGGLVGENEVSIIDSYASGTVTAGNSASAIGGLVGFNLATISNSYAAGAVTSGISSNSVGGLVGYSTDQGNITGNYATGAVTVGNLSNNIGGLVGDNNLTVTGSYATGSVTAGSSSDYIGGLVGYNSGPITNSYARGEISTGSHVGSIGGLVGYNDGATITDSYATGNTYGGIYSDNIGGLVGTNADSAVISNSYAIGAVNGYAYSGSVGGLVGVNYDSKISSSYAAGNVTAGTESNTIGGLVGENYSSGFPFPESNYSLASITNSYATGAVNGGPLPNIVGGLVGDNTGTISNSYATGLVAGAGSSFVAGLIGENNGTIVSSYWDTATTGQTNACGAYGNICSGAMALGGANPSPYVQASYAGFDFTNVWYMIDGFTRPFLRSEYSTTITNAHQLQLIDLNLGADYTLTNNIDMSELTNPSGLWNTATGFVPIGYTLTNDSVDPLLTPSASIAGSYTGTFNGSGYSISNLVISPPTLRLSDFLGLFTAIGPNATVENLEILAASVSTNYGSNIGILAGINQGKIDNVQVAGVVAANKAGNKNIGGLIGTNSPVGTITQSFTSGSVIIGIDGNGVGGLTGTNLGTINNSFSNSSVNAGNGIYNIGGLVGGNAGTINESYATGAVSGDNSSIGNISEDIGGLVGSNFGAINSSYSTNSVDGGLNSAWIGGLVGFNNAYNGFVNNSYSTGSVKGGNFSIDEGGLVGQNLGSISYSYATGLVSGSTELTSVGGFVGQNLGTITSSYWDTTTTGQVNGFGFSDPSGPVVLTGLTTAQWLTQGPAATHAAGWDFVNTWVTGYPYPVLKALPYIIVDANPATKVYGSANPAFSIASITDQNGDNASGLVNTSGLSWITAPASSGVGTYNAGGSGATAPAGYQVTYDGTLGITPKALTITAASETITAGQAITLSADYTGFVSGDNASDLTKQPVLATTATSKSPAGKYTVTVSGAADPNYAISYVDGTITIELASGHHHPPYHHYRDFDEWWRHQHHREDDRHHHDDDRRHHDGWFSAALDRDDRYRRE